MSRAAERPVDVAFLFIGGVHQAMHMAPVAAALARRSGVTVTAYAPPADAAAAARTTMLTRLDREAGERVAVVPMRPRGALRLAPAALAKSKVGRLLAWRDQLIRADVVVAAERTSTLLKRLPGRRPYMVHIPHGVGDRAKGFEPRIRLFDRVLVAGPGNRDRMLAERVVAPEACQVVGAIKLSAILNGPPPPRLFDDDRPVVLYNPHFDERLSSWRLAEPLARAVAEDGSYNLIVAPHARLGRRLSGEERARWTAFGERPGVLVDLGSERLSDMTYTRAAHVYLGDVSSQVYEFVHAPRPVVFVDAHGVDWRTDPSYRMWAMGDVVDDVAGVLVALRTARDRHAGFAEQQIALGSDALGDVGPDVPDRAADAVVAAALASRR